MPKKPPEPTESVKISSLAHRALKIEKARLFKARLPDRSLQDLASEAILAKFKPD